nr:reverse transcriptase domain-containing protein [Tanacetum cinerariifolium]
MDLYMCTSTSSPSLSFSKGFEVSIGSHTKLLELNANHRVPFQLCRLYLGSQDPQIQERMVNQQSKVVERYNLFQCINMKQPVWSTTYIIRSIFTKPNMQVFFHNPGSTVEYSECLTIETIRTEEGASWDLDNNTWGGWGEVIGTVPVDAGAQESSLGEIGNRGDQGPSANYKLTKYRTRPTSSYPIETQTPISEPVVAPVSVSIPNLKPSIPYPLRRDDERHRDQANKQIEKFYKIFKEMSFEISFTDALLLMPKFASTLKALIGNKEELSEMARTPMNEHCLAVILNKLPRKLGDPGKFLILCEFPGMDECLALADLGASINLMPLSVSKPIGIAKDVSVKVGVFHFPADFMVVDFELDPRIPLILGRCFLKTGRALIDVHKGELTLRIRNEAITYNLDQTVRCSANYNQMTTNKIDVICEMYSREVLSFSDVTVSGNPTPYDDPIVSTTFPTLTPFGDSDFLLFEEADAFLGLMDDPNSLEFNPFYYDPEGDILLLEAILNSEPLPPLPNHKQYMPSYKKELKVCEAKTVKSSVDEPPEVELKDLPPHLEYTFLEGDNKLPVIIAKELGDEEKSALIKVLKSHKRAIAWKLSDIQGINPEFYTHKILMEEDYKPAVQHQRRVNPKIHDVIKKRLKNFLILD